MKQRRHLWQRRGWVDATYPQQRLNDAWMLVLGGQFHDIGWWNSNAACLSVHME